MLQTPSQADRLKRYARRFAATVRPHHIAVLGGVAAVGLAFVAVRMVALPAPEPIRDGERIEIQVVAPIEPEIMPGSVMDVGDLVEGFEYRRPAPAVVEAAAYAPYDEDLTRAEPRPAPPRYDDRVDMGPPSPEPPPETGRDRRAPRWFGFDAPERDYRAEREARRARIEARIERERERREVRWYRSDGQPADYDGREDRRRPYEDPDDLRG